MAAKGRGTRFPENRRKKKVRRVPNRTSARAPSRSSKRRQVRSGVPCCNSRPRGSRSRSSTSARRGSVAGKGNKKEKKNEKKNEKKKRRKQKRARARALRTSALSLSLSLERIVYIYIYIYLYLYIRPRCVRARLVRESRSAKKNPALSRRELSRGGASEPVVCGVPWSPSRFSPEFPSFGTKRLTGSLWTRSLFPRESPRFLELVYAPSLVSQFFLEPCVDAPHNRRARLSSAVVPDPRGHEGRKIRNAGDGRRPGLRRTLDLVLRGVSDTERAQTATPPPKKEIMNEWTAGAFGALPVASLLGWER